MQSGITRLRDISIQYFKIVTGLVVVFNQIASLVLLLTGLMSFFGGHQARTSQLWVTRLGSNSIVNGRRYIVYVVRGQGTHVDSTTAQ